MTRPDYTIGFFLFTRGSEFPVVESLTSCSTKSESSQAKQQHLEFEVGDEILAVDGKKVATVKQCIKNFKYSTSMKVIWRIRRKHYPTMLQKVKESVVLEETPETNTSSTTPTEQVSPTSSTNNPLAQSSGSTVEATTSSSVTTGGILPHKPIGSIEPSASSTSNTSVTTTATKKEKMELPIISTSSATPQQPIITTTNVVFSASDPRSITFIPRRRSSTIPSQENTSSVVDSGLCSSNSESTTVPAELKSERPSGYGFRNSLCDSRQCYVVRTADIACSRVITSKIKIKS